jgi:hypothetical protein
MGFYGRFFDFHYEKTFFFCIIDDKNVLSMVKTEVATEIYCSDSYIQYFSASSFSYFFWEFISSKEYS